MSNILKFSSLAVTSILLSLMLIFGSPEMQTALAGTLVTAFDTTGFGANNQCAKLEGSNNHVYFCIPNDATNAQFKSASWFQSNVTNPTIHKLDIYPQAGGCGAPSNPSNPCSAGGGAGDSGGSVNAYGQGCNFCLLGQSGHLGGIWCGLSDCFTLWISNNSYSNQLLRVTPSFSAVTGYMNITQTTLLSPLLTGIDTFTGGIGGISVFYLYCSSVCGTASLGTLAKVGGTSQMGVIATLGTNQFFTGDSTSAKGWGISSMDMCWWCDGNSTNNANNKYLVISSRQGAANGNRMITIDAPDTMTEVCGATPNSIVSSTSQHTSILRINNSTRFIWSDDLQIWSVNLHTCAPVKATLYGTVGITNYISAIYTNSSQSGDINDPVGTGFHALGKVFWVQHGSTNTIASVTQVNSTSFNTNVNFDSVNGATISNYIRGTNPFNSLVSDVYAKTILRTDSTLRLEILYLTSFNGGGGGTVIKPPVCFNTQPYPNTQQICVSQCDASGNYNILCPPQGCPNGVSICPYASVSFPQTMLVGTNVTTSTNNLSCSIGLSSCTNTNIKTNGVGYILTLLLFIFAIGLLWQIASWTDHKVGEIPAFVWFALTAIVLFISFGLGFTDGIIAYTTIIAGIGLGALGIGSYLMGRQH